MMAPNASRCERGGAMGTLRCGSPLGSCQTHCLTRVAVQNHQKLKKSEPQFFLIFFHTRQFFQIMASAATLPHPESVAPPAPESVAPPPPPLPPLGLQEQAEQPSEPCSGLSIKLQPQRRKRYCGLGRRRGAPFKTPRRTAERLARRGFGRRTVRLLVITLNKYRTVSRARQADDVYRSPANVSVKDLKDSSL